MGSVGSLTAADRTASVARQKNITLGEMRASSPVLGYDPRWVGELRNVQKIFQFGWYSIQQAWRGCWTRANEQAGLFGGAILAVLLYFFPPRFAGHGMIMAPETIWGTAALTVLLTAGSVILAFLIIFTTRLVLAPTRLYWDSGNGQTT
jgi:hypothetical protein